MRIKFPVGTDDFREVREGGYYYVDKTGLIPKLLDDGFKAKLITRPRRFGKTLTMSMMEDFFDISRDSRGDFAGLTVMGDGNFCGEWMNRWPVVFLSFKGIEGRRFEDAFSMLNSVVSTLFNEYDFIEGCAEVKELDFLRFRKVKLMDGGVADIKDSLLLLTRVLHAYYGKPVILLIDEYDVPLAKANDKGYYDEMLDVVRGMLGSALKGNKYLKFAVLTGCLRISKESIFTGMNNFTVDTVTDKKLAKYLGFTDDEVGKMLSDTGFSDHLDEVRLWYDGYRFGDTKVYCPWDVLNHVNALQDDPSAMPRNYWSNTSGNDVIYSAIDRRNMKVNEKFETLLSGGRIEEPIVEDLTYRELKSSERNLWSLLYMTGYLTLADAPKGGVLPLRIPNEELKSVFKTKIAEWFEDMVQNTDRSVLFKALWDGDGDRCSEILSRLLFDTISCYDYYEDFYHAFLAGVLVLDDYSIKSNREQGEGRSDIVLRDGRERRAIVFELKRAGKEEDMGRLCDEALKQICDRKYAQEVKSEGYGEVICYGVCFYKKRCLVRAQKALEH